jgi:putative nucleotidyltransferase with HDIG domain
VDRKSQEFNGIKESCRNHLASLVSEGLDPFPFCVFDLDVLLNAPVVDLRKVSRALNSDARFSRRVLHLSNVALIHSSESARNVTDAAVLLGPCLFHTAVLLCAVTEFGEHASRDSNAASLWSHGVQVAAMSERIAELSEYPVRGMAYVAGLFHDIGHLPLRTVVREQERTFDGLAGIRWQDNIGLERDIFGLDHCQIGEWMAKSWGFSSSLIDAVMHHHEPSGAENDPQLAEIVCAAEYCGSASSAQTAAHGPSINRNVSSSLTNFDNVVLV